MRIFAVILTVMLGATPVLAQGDARTRADPVTPTAAKPAAGAKLKPAARRAAKPKPVAETEGKTRPVRKKQARQKPQPAAATKPAAAAAKPATSGTANAAPAPEKSSPALRESYNAIPYAERIALQTDLTWGGDYSGLIDGEFSDRLAEAARAYQKRHKEPVTGLLTPQQRATLAAAVAPRKTAVGWKLIEDTSTGARLGVPEKFATKTTPAPGGARWSSEQGQLQIQTFRIDTGAALESVFEQQKKLPRRRIASSSLDGDRFVITGMQGLKKMVVRGFAQNGEVRGLIILYDQAMEGSIDPLVVPLTSAYVPFPRLTMAGGTGMPRRKVEYGTAVFVSTAGHALTDRRLIDGCSVIVLPGHGNAERVAIDEERDLALLRVYGAQSTPIGWSGAPAEAAGVTLLGIADPQAQGGGDAISAVQANVAASANGGRLETPPAPGFSGAAAFDGEARFAGVVVTKPSLVAGPIGVPQAAVVPVEQIRGFLVSNQLTLASGKPGLDQAKAAVTRVICVRN